MSKAGFPRGVKFEHIRERFEFGIDIAILSDQKLPGGCPAAIDHEGGATLAADRTKFTANLNGKGCRAGDVSPFGKAADFFQQMGAMQLEERQETQRSFLKLFLREFQQFRQVVQETVQSIATLLAVLTAQVAMVAAGFDARVLIWHSCLLAKQRSRWWLV